MGTENLELRLPIKFWIFYELYGNQKTGIGITSLRFPWHTIATGRYGTQYAKFLYHRLLGYELATGIN